MPTSSAQIHKAVKNILLFIAFPLKCSFCLHF